MPQVLDAPVEEKTTTLDPKFKDFLDTLKKPIEEEKTPNNFACVLHNDNTSEGFTIVAALQEAYGLPRQRAVDIMMAVHNGIRGVICVLPEGEAREKTDKAMRLVHEAGYREFTITVEEEK